MAIIEQRFLRGPNLWSSGSCLSTVLELGNLRHALSSDVACFPDALLALLPGLHAHAATLQRGCYLAEAVTMVMLEVQRLSGAPAPSSFAAIVMGRASQTRILVASASQAAGMQACAIALAVVADLYAGKRAALPDYLGARRKAQPVRPAPDQELAVLALAACLSTQSGCGRARPLPVR